MEAEKRKKMYTILDSLPVETIAQVFKAGSLVANGIDNHRADHINAVTNSLRQENTKQTVSIIASKLELAAHT